MFMRFQVQFQRDDGRWRFVGAAGDSGFIDAGRARPKAPRQAGQSFRLTPPGAGKVFTLRGLVTFEWRKGGTVVRRSHKRTTAGHRSSAGADPPGFSAAECTVSA
jgi:hypothetical protein